MGLNRNLIKLFLALTFLINQVVHSRPQASLSQRVHNYETAIEAIIQNEFANPTYALRELIDQERKLGHFEFETALMKSLGGNQFLTDLTIKLTGQQAIVAAQKLAESYALLRQKEIEDSLQFCQNPAACQQGYQVKLKKIENLITLTLRKIENSQQNQTKSMVLIVVALALLALVSAQVLVIAFVATASAMVLSLMGFLSHLVHQEQAAGLKTYRIVFYQQILDQLNVLKSQVQAQDSNVTLP